MRKMKSEKLLSFIMSFLMIVSICAPFAINTKKVYAKQNNSYKDKVRKSIDYIIYYVDSKFQDSSKKMSIMEQAILELLFQSMEVKR
ncbi:hypothetical protein ACFIJ5_12650 [Haloimpatiens sp. FM7330]|uniref:hypothetical protein n=1 Tax=Haloimpatiens sp. FM7330 TaxID=3298610 RepID=UPI00363AD273